jgi:WD repeat-containing protein 21A
MSCIILYFVDIIIFCMLQVWKYSETDKIVDGALEQIHIGVQTPEGQTETDVLLTGGVNGSLRYIEIA